MSCKDPDRERREHIHEECPLGAARGGTPSDPDPIQLGRRDLLKLAALGGAAAAGVACETIVPPGLSRRVPGTERRVTTVCGACPAGCGISVRLVGGLVVGVFGQKGHPVNDGGLCARGVAEIQKLYHPERLRAPLARPERGRQTRPIEWQAAIARLPDRLRSGPAVIGVGRLSALEDELVGRIANAIDATVVRVGLPFDELPRDALRRTLGSDDFVFDLCRANCVLSLGADWLQAWPSPVEAQRAFANLRRLGGDSGLIMASPRLGVTAGHADKWIPVPADELDRFGLSIAHTLLGGTGGWVADRARMLQEQNPSFRAWSAFVGQDRFSAAAVKSELGLKEGVIEGVAADLARRSRPVVVADRSRSDAQRTAMALNVLLGAIDREGGLLRRPPPPWGQQGTTAPDARAFPSSTSPAAILLYRANPGYLQAAGSGWAEGLRRANFVCSATDVIDESCDGADLLLPLSTPLESRHLVCGATADGQQFVSTGPPAVLPLHDSKEGPQMLMELAAVLGSPLPWGSYRELVRERVGMFAELDENKGWFASALPQTAEQPEAYALEVGPLPAIRSEDPRFPLVLQPQLPIAFLGGLGAHLPYLRGLPGSEGAEPWQTVAVLSIEKARALDIDDGQKVWVESPQGRIHAVARVREGLHHETVVVPIGLGRRALGRFAAGQGSNVVELLTTSADGETDWTTTRVRVRRAG